MGRGKTWTDKEIDKLKKEVSKGKTYDQLEEVMEDRTKISIRNKCRRLNCHAARSQTHRTKINHNFFNNINTEEKAYVLGWFVSDGYLKIKESSCYTFGIEITDVEMLKTIKNIMESEHNIYERNNRNTYTFKAGSRTICKDLMKLGYTTNKSCEAIYPDIDSSLDLPFIMGVFDGDGCVSIKNEKYLSAQIDGTKELLSEIKNKFKNIKGHIYTRNESRNTYRLIYFAERAEKFLSTLYDNCKYSLDRKREKFERFLLEAK